MTQNIPFDIIKQFSADWVYKEKGLPFDKGSSAEGGEGLAFYGSWGTLGSMHKISFASKSRN